MGIFLAVEGFVVDDRHQAKDLAQVYKDVVRDTVVIDGKEYVCASGDIIIQSLFSQIYDLFRRHHCIGVGEEEEEGDDCHQGSSGNSDEFNVEKDHYITKNALAYTRAVLLASCRTVSGGDTYDGKMVVCHCVVCVFPVCIFTIDIVFPFLYVFFFIFGQPWISCCATKRSASFAQTASTWHPYALMCCTRPSMEKIVVGYHRSAARKWGVHRCHHVQV